MKITRRTNILIKTAREFFVRRPGSEAIRCLNCDDEMMQVQDFAEHFAISRREIYRLIEAGRIHFIETDEPEIYLCPASSEEFDLAFSNTTDKF